ncbi:MAG: hypothetical protein HY043_06420 [Verrucomicrobia bacterium]|nr:hypothetical protein [Verrucomicrobiota bacterium]
MTNFDRLNICRSVAVLLIMMLLLQGCASVQVSSADGRPKLIGFGRVESVKGANGQIYRITAPGLSLRFHAYAPGVSLGWNETELFYPLAPAGAGLNFEPVAIQTRSVGLDLAPGRVMAGYDRIFAIPMPKGTNVVQMISYSAENPSNTIVQRKEASR